MPLSAAEAEQLIRAGIAALQQGRAAVGRSNFQQVLDRGSPLPPPWLLLAQACRQLGEHQAEESALDEMLRTDPRNISALIMKGDCRARSGDRRGANSFYQAALNRAAFVGKVSPMLAAELQRVESFCENSGAVFEHQLEQRLLSEGIDESRRSSRLQQSLDILLGKKQIYLQQPNSFYFAGLPQIQFYEREDFPWLAGIEAATPAIRAELEAILAEDSAFQPYIEVRPDRPLPTNPLLGDPSWSAFHLWKGGQIVEPNAARCPRTMEALERAPMPVIRGRSPMALFSLLRPGAHIEPHHGMLNTRLICHIPIIAPPGCRLRVGNEIRSWEQGKALIFDDSFEHEAWNESGDTRVVLLFEIWRPEISEGERSALTAMFEAITDFGGEPPEA